MTTKIQKWGNSQAVRLPKHLLDAAQISIGDDVEVKVCEGAITITPTRRVRGRYRIADLVAQMPEDNEPDVVDWGPPVGHEEW